MLRYKESVLPTVARFFRYKNDIDIYIEDENDNEFYLALFSRIARNANVKIGRLTALGGRKAVIDACVLDQVKRNRRRLYVIDGDLYLIHNQNTINLKHLYIHDSYCIENYLIDEDAFLEVLHDGLVMPKDKISKILTFENFLKRISNPLIELFLHYGLVFNISPTNKTVSNGVGKFCFQNKGISVLSDEKINTEIAELKNILLQVLSENEYNDKIYQLRLDWPVDIKTLLQIVSAKDYILPLLQFRFAKFKGNGSFKISRNSLRLRLAKLCKLDGLKELEKVIRSN